MPLFSFSFFFNLNFLSIFCHRYHPACVGMTIEEAKKLEHFVCSECSSDDDVKRSQNGFTSSPIDDNDIKVRLLTVCS